MMSFADVPVCDSDAPMPEPLLHIGSWITKNIRPKELFPLAYRFWPGTLIAGPVLEVTAEPARPARIDTLWWPWGASRFAQAHFVVTEEQLEAIRAVVVVDGESVTGELNINDGGTSTIAQMWMLPAWPLSTAVANAGMYLLTLVDDRYWWWGTPVQFHVTEGGTSWEEVYEEIADDLGITIVVDPIDSAYGTPVADYSTAYRPAPNVLDAVAFSVGQRIVRDLDGTVTAMNASTALASVTAQLASVNPKYAGGPLALVAE